MAVKPQKADFLGSLSWLVVVSGCISGHLLGVLLRNFGPLYHLLSHPMSQIDMPFVMSSAGLSCDSTYLQVSDSVSSCISATLVPTNTLNRQDCDSSQLNTVLESDHRVMLWMGKVSSVLKTLASCAPDSATHNSRRGTVCCFLEAKSESGGNEGYFHSSLRIFSSQVCY